MSRDPATIRRDNAPRAGTLGDLRRNGLDVRLFCLACPATVDLDIQALVARHGEAMTVQALYDRARCRRCGRPADNLHVALRAPPMVPRRDR